MRQRVTVPNIPQQIKEKIASEIEPNVSYNDLVSRIVGERFGVIVPPTGRKPRASSMDPLILRVPEELWFKMRINAARRRATMRGLVIETLAKHYGIETASPLRRTRGAR